MYCLYCFGVLSYSFTVDKLVVLCTYLGVILPTCYDYVTINFGAEEWFYGLTLAAISISNFLVGPPMGALYDRTHQTKLFVLFLNLFEIGGALLDRQPLVAALTSILFIHVPL